jgi:hypothetical protein
MMVKKNMSHSFNEIGWYKTRRNVKVPRGIKGLFSWQNFWRNATVAVSLLFDKYCPIMV